MKQLATALASTFFLCAAFAVAEPRVYTTSFEDVSDFDGFYIVPQDHKGARSHDLSTEQIRSARYAHKGWIYGENRGSTLFRNNNHRAYPTEQLYKLAGGGSKIPVEIEFWVWLDMESAAEEWLSLATLDRSTSVQWDPVLVNLSDAGFVHLMHVPRNGQGVRTFQTDTTNFPMRQWVKLNVRLHFDAKEGYAEVRQNDRLVSSAEVLRGDGLFTQAHLGLYAPPLMTHGVVYNDDLIITEI
jgi:hypothetical protein